MPVTTATQYQVHVQRLSDKLPRFHCLEPTEADFLYKQIFEGADYTQYGITIKPGDTVIDVGGNTGMFAVYTLFLTGGRCNLYTFEPVPILAELCEQNIAQHKTAETVAKVFSLGLTAPDLVGPCSFSFFPRYSLLSSSHEWSEADKDAIAARMQLFKGSADPAVFAQLRQVVEESLVAETVAVELRTFASVRAEEGITQIDLLKVDVEKAEWDVLCGISDADWAITRQAAIETHVIGDRVERIVGLLKGKGFTNVTVGDMGVPKYLAFKTTGLLELPTGAAKPAPGSDDALVCNIYATK